MAGDHRPFDDTFQRCRSATLVDLPVPTFAEATHPGETSQTHIRRD